MKFDYNILPQHRLIVTRFAGAFTLEDLTGIARRLWADPRYTRGYNGLADLTDMNLAVGRGDFRALVDFVRGQKDTSEGRWAAVTNSPLATACGLIYQRAMAARHPFEVYSTFEAAGAFVGVDLRGGQVAGKTMSWES